MKDSQKPSACSGSLIKPTHPNWPNTLGLVYWSKRERELMIQWSDDVEHEPLSMYDTDEYEVISEGRRSSSISPSF